MRASVVARASLATRPAARPARLRAASRTARPTRVVRRRGGGGSSGGRLSSVETRASSGDDGSDPDARDPERNWSVASVLGDDRDVASLSNADGTVREDDHLVLDGFDVDECACFVISCRFFFLWVGFGYVAVPAYAAARSVAPAELPPVELALCVAAAEAAKLGFVTQMLDAESIGTKWGRDLRSRLGGGFRGTVSVIQGAATFSDEDKRKTFRDVAIGARYGALASVTARVADYFVTNAHAHAVDGPDAPLAGHAGGALDIFQGVVASGWSQGNERFSSAAILGCLCVATSSVILAPITEELFFRGFLLPATARSLARRFRHFRNSERSSVHAAIVLTSIAFAAAHFQPGDFAELAACGACFGWARASSKQRGGLVAPCIAHAVFNLGVLLESLANAWDVKGSY